MAIQSGQRLGPYEILSAIGAGGMGEVYRARDTRLDRTVAIKILQDHLADRVELRERFEREAKTIASLNHPHICTLYDVGHQNGTDYLVMEYLEGETLAERLKKGPLPLNQVLQYAIEISDALDKAHRKGITHRDLKPSNILLTKSGAKLLDFGLAKLKQEAAPIGSLSQRATVDSAMTAEGTILGTLQYMAPEQVEGKQDEIDAKTDIFAFGAVVYEMATGKKAFEGKSQASVIGKIMETDPPSMVSLQPMTPPALDRAVKRCLAKEPDDRWQTARDLHQELKWISDSGPQSGLSVPAGAQQNLKKRVAWMTAALAALMAALVAGSALYLHRTPPPEREVARFTVGPPKSASFSPDPIFLTISPDGSKLAFIAAGASGKRQLWIRPLDSPTAEALPGTDDASSPFWSADSRYVAFAAEGKLKKIAISGGPAMTLTDWPGDAGGSWNAEDVILFSSGTMINRVSAAGGAATPVTALDASRQEVLKVAPCFLQDGRHFLYNVVSVGVGGEKNSILVGSLDSKESKFLMNATSNTVYIPPGYLLFDRLGTLMAQPFDGERLQMKGEAVPIAEGLQFNQITGATAFAASNNGVLVYRRAAEAPHLTLVWVDRNGSERQLAAPARNYVMPKVSPDGQRVAAGIEGAADSQIWLYDLGRDTLTRLTFEGTNNIDPVWTPDGKRIVFKGPQNRLFWQPADGSGPAEELTKSEPGVNNAAGSFSPDGQLLVFMRNNPFPLQLYVLPLKDAKPQPFLRTSSNETAPRFSPDGHFIAYASDESGHWEIYVRPYPGPGGKWQISTDGGGEPVWNPKGRELFYRQGNKMMAVEVTTQPTFFAGKPKTLFEAPYTPTPRSFPDYDVSPGGQRFLMLKPSEQAQSPEQINVVLNWFEELKQKIPAGKK